MAIVEHLAEKFPDKRLWPADNEERTLARSVSAEMHSGFANLRSHMPLSCRARRPGAGRGPSVQEDIDRICEIWRECRTRYGVAGEFLFGEFTAADAMFAPVASRFQTYGVELDRVEAAYARAILTTPTVRVGLRMRTTSRGASPSSTRLELGAVHHSCIPPNPVLPAQLHPC